MFFSLSEQLFQDIHLNGVGKIFLVAVFKTGVFSDGGQGERYFFKVVVNKRPSIKDLGRFR